ncbi:MAG TPA: hypothetical protein VKB86_06055, partial [Pyrinomonadaceae bacterium]|nr:hypothetical protein [Pyrinomonadaceae bacterium]
YYTAHLEWFNKYLGGAPPPWTTEQFLRNEVFDRTSGQRINEPDVKPTTQPKETQGKPDVKPKTP